MNSPQIQPRPKDLVLGGQIISHYSRSLVLGGLEGVKKRLKEDEGERIKALADAIHHGDSGLELLFSALNDPSLLVQWEAFLRLQDRPEAVLQALLDSWLPIHEFNTISIDDNPSEPIKCQVRHFREPLAANNDSLLAELTMILIPPGNVLIGSPESESYRSFNEGPQQQVNVSPFFMAQTPITQAQWQAVAQLPSIHIPLGSTPSKYKGEDHPVESVCWYEAVEFCDRLTHLTGNQYRLPTEAEWEYACRAGTVTPFYWGETMPQNLGTFLSLHDNQNSWLQAYRAGGPREGRTRTKRVAISGLANAFGLHDMHGHIWEWCLDYDHANYVGIPTDGKAWLTGGDEKSRILRGGSWRNELSCCRSAARFGDYADIRDDSIGFRVVCSTRKSSETQLKHRKH